MSEANKTAKKTDEKDVKTSIRAEKSEKKAKESDKEDVKSEEFSLTEEKKDALGLEELPDDIKKKLEKKQSEKIAKFKNKKVRKKRKKVARKVTVGKAFVKATYNNTIVTLTDNDGNVLSWASAGIAGFKGPKKSTPYAASIITRLAVGKAREEYGLSEVSVYVKGVGTGRESAVRGLNNNGLIVTLIKDITPVPHNGCRNRKPRRV